MYCCKVLSTRELVVHTQVHLVEWVENTVSVFSSLNCRNIYVRYCIYSWELVVHTQMHLVEWVENTVSVLSRFQIITNEIWFKWFVRISTVSTVLLLSVLPNFDKIVYKFIKIIIANWPIGTVWVHNTPIVFSYCGELQWTIKWCVQRRLVVYGTNYYLFTVYWFWLDHIIVVSYGKREKFYDHVNSK